MLKNPDSITKAVRLFVLIKILFDNGTITEKGITKLFRIHSRSFYRDLATIRELGIPISFEYGRYKIDFTKWRSQASKVSYEIA